MIIEILKYNILYNYWENNKRKITNNILDMHSLIHSYPMSKQNFWELVCKIFLQRFIPVKKLY